MTTSDSKPSPSSHESGDGTSAAASLGTPERILVLLQLHRVAIADQLIHVLKRFRGAQQSQLLDLLQALHAQGVLENVAAHFDRKLDVKDEMERYLQDLLKMHHYITHHNADAELSRSMMQLYGAFGEGMDRQLVTKVFQTIGFPLCATFCFLCAKLSFKHQQELLTLFAGDLPELRAWIHWLTKVRRQDKHGETNREQTESANDNTDSDFVAAKTTPYDVVVECFVKMIYERCTLSWLALLRPLSHPIRVAVVHETQQLSMASMKQLARFYETAGISVQKYLDLDPAVRDKIAVLLDEFPIATLQTLFVKFNCAKLVNCILGGLRTLPKKELVQLIDTLGIADNDAIDLFVGALFGYRRTEEFTRLFLNFTAQNRSHFLDLLLASAAHQPSPEKDDDVRTEGNADGVDETGDNADAAATDPECSGDSSAWLVFDLFLNAHFNSYDIVIQKLSTLPAPFARQMITSIAKYTSEELAMLGEGIESSCTTCLASFLTLFAALSSEMRHVLVKWVHVVPGEEAAPIYDVLFARLQLVQDNEHPSSNSAESVVDILNLITSLALKDKVALCGEILLGGLNAKKSSDALDTTGFRTINDNILRFLCACTISVHKAIKLFRILPAAQYESITFLLRTQRIPEQVALTRLMLSLPSDANCRLLEKVRALSTDVLDLFFEVLLLVPKVEYRMLAKLLISRNVSSAQLRSFIQVAASLMNQASSRELVIFTADLPVLTRNQFFDMLASDPVKGVLLRIVACSSRLPPELLHQMIAMLHPLSWGTRSSLIEQIRALDDTQHVQDLVDVAHELDPDDLQSMVLLFNILQVPARICFSSLFLGLARAEKHLALLKLNAMPRDKVQAYCTTICDDSHLSIGTSFFRVFGPLDSVYQSCVLRLLQRESCWSFLSLMADCVAKNPEPNVLNGFAASLALFTHEAEFLALRSVVQEALASSTSLEELVLVFCHFRDRTKLLEFLKFVRHLSKFTRSTVLFRVLSKFKQTVFLYEMCRMLDLDDALFALKRLDRLWQRRYDELERALHALSERNGVAGIKDEFCNLILGFHEKKPTLEHHHTQQQYIAPRTSASATDRSRNGSAKHPGSEEEEYRHILFVSSSHPLTHSALSLERYLRRVQSDDTLASRWKSAAVSPEKKCTRGASVLSTTAGSVPECVEDDASGSLASSTESDGDDLKKEDGVDRLQFHFTPRHDEPSHTLSEAPALASVFALTESASLPSISPQTSGRQRINDVPESEIWSPQSQYPSSEALAAAAEGNKTHRANPTALPPIVAQQKPTFQGAVEVRQRSEETTFPSSNTAATSTTPSLCRSESAPTTLGPYVIPEVQKPKRYRGLAAALHTPSDFHVGRDRGTSIFKKGCADIQASGSSRIRVSKTVEAQSHVLDVRVQQRLGKRRDPDRITPLQSPLLRQDRHTFEKASAAMATAAKSRQDAALQGFAIARVNEKSPSGGGA